MHSDILDKICIFCTFDSEQDSVCHKSALLILTKFCLLCLCTLDSEHESVWYISERLILTMNLSGTSDSDYETVRYSSVRLRLIYDII